MDLSTHCLSSSRKWIKLIHMATASPAQGKKMSPNVQTLFKTLHNCYYSIGQSKLHAKPSSEGGEINSVSWREKQSSHIAKGCTYKNEKNNCDPLCKQSSTQASNDSSNNRKYTKCARLVDRQLSSYLGTHRTNEKQYFICPHYTNIPLNVFKWIRSKARWRAP